MMSNYVKQFILSMYLRFLDSTFCLKFHTFAGNVGQNKNKIDNIKTIKDPLRRLE